MSFGSFLRRASHVVLPSLGFLGGTADGLIQGNGLGSALREGVGSGINAAVQGLAPGLGPIGGTLLGAGAGALTSGLSGESGLSGALRGGIGGYLSGGGLSSILDAAGSGLSGITDSIGLTGQNSPLGTMAGSPLANGVGPTQGSGIIGAGSRGLSDIGSALGIGSGGGTTYGSSNMGSSYSGGPVTSKDAVLPWLQNNSTPGSTLPWNIPASSASNSSGAGLSALLGGISSTSANNKAEKALLNSQQQALSRYRPYIDARFEPGDLTQDPGYQFRLQQGEQALGRQQSARGGYFSGNALREAEDYGQGLADTTYNEAYNRWLQQNQQNIGVADRTSGLDIEGGNARANAGVANSNALNRSLSSLLGGYGAYTNTGAPQSQDWLYDPRTGQRISA